VTGTARDQQVRRNLRGQIRAAHGSRPGVCHAHLNGMDHTINHRRSPRRRLLSLGGAVTLAALGVAGSADAANTDPSPSLTCNLLECAAAYIGVRVPDLSSAVVAETRRTGLPGMMVAIDQLDAAEQDKLAATGPTDGPMQDLARYSIITTHNTLRDLLLAYAVGNLISPIGVP
jgi:hypothetical protein